ncbi:MAG: hypothetical protein HUU60_07870 [Armatimonadetes bacterium]|nr:hypothetical protein [Armatimonadota bacterium]
MISILLACLIAQQPIRSGDSQPIHDPWRPVTRIDRTGFKLQYYTSQPCDSRVQVRQGDLPMTTFGKGLENVWVGALTFARPGQRTLHEIEITGLEPGKKYFYRILDPGAVPTGQEKRWGAKPPWRREQSVITQASRGYKSIVRIPVKVLLMPNVVNLKSVTSDAMQPLPLSEEELRIVRQEYAYTSRFFFVNSGMRLWVDFQIFVDNRWQRWSEEPEGIEAFYKGWPACRSWSGEDFRGPGGGDFTVVDTRNLQVKNAQPVQEETPYMGQIEQAFPRRWNPTLKKWEFYNSGGGTFGADEFPRGVTSRSQYLGGGDTAWLACHEFHHQLESHGAFSLSDREDERVVFNHYEPRRREQRPDGTYAEATWATSGKHGEHWDGMAFWDRTLTDAQWLRMYMSYAVVVRDADEDGVPDDDPRLPLDEKRFGSDPRRDRTDGRMGDLDKTMLSHWIPSCLQASWTKPPFQGVTPNPRSIDSDGDGQPDDIDPLPLFAYSPFVWPKRATVDGQADEWRHTPVSGQMDEGGAALTFKHGHDDAAYYGVFTVSGDWKRVYATLDGEGEGFFSTNRTLAIEFTNGADVAFRSIHGNSKGLNWKASKSGSETVIEFSIPNREEGPWFWRRGGREVGVSIDLFDEKGTGYSVYEPYRAIYFRMLEPHGQFPMPSGAPSELGTDAKRFMPGDAAVAVTGSGWRVADGAWRCDTHPETHLTIEAPDATEFDLWIDIEAKQDAILAAFLPGSQNPTAGTDYVLFVGGYANTVTRFRLFGREEGEADQMMSPGRHRVQLSRRNGTIWGLMDGKPILWAKDPNPTAKINRLAIIGGYDGNQVVREIRARW